MMTDLSPHIRELDLRRVMKARAVNTSGQIRSFNVHAKLNFDAVEYFVMIYWAACRGLPLSQLWQTLSSWISWWLQLSSLQSVPATHRLRKDTWSWLWIEITRRFQPCTRSISTANADFRVETWFLSLHIVTVWHCVLTRYCRAY
jgi:hypothetical protein